MRNIVGFILVGLLLSSCNLAKPLDQAVTAAEQLAFYYDQDIAALLSAASLSEHEMRVIANSIQTASRIRAQFESARLKPNVNIRLLEIEYGRLRNAYLAVRAIAVAHESEYSEDTWYTFQVFDVFASTLDQEFGNLIEASKTNEAIVNTISLANSILRIAALL
jgi:predicted Zn-dependent protease